MAEISEFDRQAAEWDRWEATYDDDSAGFLDDIGPVDFLADAAGGRPCSNWESAPGASRFRWPDAASQ